MHAITGRVASGWGATGEAAAGLPPAEECSHSGDADARILALMFCAVVDTQPERRTASLTMCESGLARLTTRLPVVD